MTPAQAAWLRKLKDEGPQVVLWPAAYQRRAWKAGMVDRPDGVAYRITPEGIAALEEWEAGK